MNNNNIINRISEFKQFGLIVAILILTILMSIVNPVFISFENIIDILLNTSVIAIAAVGMTMIILTGEIDLSVGSQLAVSASLSAIYIDSGGALIVSILIGVLSGSLMGLVNGFLVYKTRIHSIVITLGTMSIFRGTNLLILHGDWLTGLPEKFWLFGNLPILNIPLPIWIMIAIIVIFSIFLSQTVFGRKIYSVGDNSSAARLSGINVEKIKMVVFIMNGALVGFAGVVFAARYGWVISNCGKCFEFSVIAATVIGGASILGGRGIPFGSLLGALLMGIIPNALVLIKVPVTWEKTILGVLIIIAVIIDDFITNKSKKRCLTSL